MAELLDEHGNLFGVVNVVDALVVLLALAVVVAGVGLVWGGTDGDRDTAATDRTVVYVDYRTDPVEPYVADAIPEGSIETANVSSIENKSVAPADVVTENESGALSVRSHPIHRTVTLRVGLPVTRDGGEFLYAGTSLEVGTGLTLDLGPTTVSGRVTAVEPGDS
ncbi:DUF4330 family protein [Haloarcula onubensis]|uniref:DUF4330 family protein n=1 Tax=Haloarcula onubensis TaxID=2950539 RepID=A0ABU2FLV2_9EURY|nr:DUF4330 family protein [Halomicroarcula sp. S3CR25-11]MDS0281267.1 DUF4330 family protein [Halomicroarcula sp. S3CR25-11]